MEYNILLIGMLMIALGISLIKYCKILDSNQQLECELTKLKDIYHDVLYEKCVLEDKIEKIRNLNIIDYSTNDYYKELLTVNNKI